MPSTSSETNFITRLPAVRLPKSLTNIAPMTTATFPNAIVPLIINTTAFLLIAATKGSRKTVMPPVTGCTLPAVTVRVRETPPSPIPEVAEARPPTTAETPVIIPINPVVIPLLMKPGALAALIPVPTAAAEHAPVVLLARLPLLPAQAARHRPPVRVLLVPGVRAPLLQVHPALPPAAAEHLLRDIFGLPEFLKEIIIVGSAMPATAGVRACTPGLKMPIRPVLTPIPAKLCIPVPNQVTEQADAMKPWRIAGLIQAMPPHMVLTVRERPVRIRTPVVLIRDGLLIIAIIPPKQTSAVFLIPDIGLPPVLLPLPIKNFVLYLPVKEYF